MSILLVLVLLKHCYIYKTEVVIKMCFAKELFLLFVVNHEKFLVVLAYCLRNLFEVVHNSNVNEIIRAVSNLFIFFTERFYRHEKQKDATKQKHKKHKKHKDATRQKHKKHKKHKDATRQKYKKHKKHKNANKRISEFFPLRCFLSG